MLVRNFGNVGGSSKKDRGVKGPEESFPQQKIPDTGFFGIELIGDSGGGCCSVFTRGLRYSPMFGKAWITAIGKTEEDTQSTPAPFVSRFNLSLNTSLKVAPLINAVGLTTLTDGLLIGLLTGIVFIVTAMASESVFCEWM